MTHAATSQQAPPGQQFLLRADVGEAAIRRIGSYLRSYGTGHHWFERYRGQVFIFVSDAKDEAILRSRFCELLDAAGDLRDEPGGRSAAAP